MNEDTQDHSNEGHHDHISMMSPFIGLSFGLVGFSLLSFAQNNLVMGLGMAALFIIVLAVFVVHEIRQRKAAWDERQIALKDQSHSATFMGKKMWMWIFLISEVVFFTILIGISFSLRLVNDPSLGFQDVARFCGIPTNTKLFNIGDFPKGWVDSEGKTPREILNIWVTTINTFILIVSSYTMVKAHEQAEHKNFLGQKDGKDLFFKLGAGKLLLVTAAIGAIFLGVQIYEYTLLITRDHFTLGSGLFGATFYLQTGFHGAHVLGGIILLLLMAYKTFSNGMEDASDIELAGLYWHFIDVVWVMLFTIVYLI